MPEYMRNREGGEESEGFFCRFTFGQFFALLVLEVFTIFFVFYLGAKYGRDLLGLERQAQVADVGDATAVEGGAVKVQTTADPEVAKMVDDLISKAETPELKDRIRSMIDSAQGTKTQNAEKPELIVIGEPPASGITAAQESAPPASAQQQDGNATVEMGEAVAAAIPPSALPQQEAAQAAAPVAQQQQAQQTSAIRVKSADNAKYSIQVGSYPQMGEANKTAEFWKAKGYPAYVMIADIPERGRWYRVRLGGFETRKDAQNYLNDLKTETDVDALVVMNEQ